MSDMNTFDICPHDPERLESRDDVTSFTMRVRKVGCHLIPDTIREHRANWTLHSWGLYIIDRPGVPIGWHGQEQAMPQDAITVVPPLFPFDHPYAPDTGIAYILLEMPRIPSSIASKLFDRIMFVRDENMLQRFRGFARWLSEEQRPGLVLGQEALGIAALCFNQILLELPEEQRELCLFPERTWGRLRPSLQFIDKNIDQSIALAEVAREQDCSPQHCIRLFRKHLGKARTNIFSISA